MKKKNTNKNTFKIEVTLPTTMWIEPNDWLESGKDVLKVKSLEKIHNQPKGTYYKVILNVEVVEAKYSCSEFAKRFGCCWYQNTRFDIYKDDKVARTQYNTTRHDIASADLRKANMGVKGCRVG